MNANRAQEGRRRQWTPTAPRWPQLLSGPARTPLRPGVPAALAEPAGAAVVDQPSAGPGQIADPVMQETAAPHEAVIAERPLAATSSAAERVDTGLPEAARVLAVVARPGQESADLGGVLLAFGLHGAQLAVMCLTRGEASEVNSATESLEAIRPWELRTAAALLGVSSVTIADYPDGRLGYLPPASLAEHIARTAERIAPDLLFVIDPAAHTDLDIAAVARATAQVASERGLPVLARTVPGPGARWRIALGPVEAQVRLRQRQALAAHRSQVVPRAPGVPATGDPRGPGDDRELVRWLVTPSPR